MRIQSNDVVILDTTDTKKIDLHITSNHPTVQIYDQNASQGTLTPDWSNDALVLTPVVYIDSEPMVDDASAKFSWTKITGSETNETKISDAKILTISNNDDLNESPTVRYRCAVEYNNKSFFNEITFARVSAGKDGASGSSAPAVRAQYSVDGNTGWTSTLNALTHKYIRFSYDNGATWTSAIKIAGEDGKSVQIKGVAYAKTTPVAGQVIVLYSDASTTTSITNATNGDSYLVDGYLCVYNGANFVCTGQIQGPPGQKGDSYYLFIRYADNINGGGISTSPTGKSYIGFYRSSVNQVPTDVSSATWNWAKFVGEDAKSIVLSANAQVFKIDKSNTMTPATITVTAQAINTAIPSSGWTYSVDGGKTFSATVPTGVSRSGNVVTLTGASVTQNSIVIKASDGTYSDFLTIYKVFDGSDGAPGGKGDSAPIAFLTNENISFAANAQGQVTGTTIYCNMVAYTGTTQVVPTVGTILSTELPTGMTIGTITTVSNQVRIPIVIANNATLGSAQNVNGVINIPVTSPVSTTLQLTWSKINAGANGTSASLVNVTPSALYFKSTKGKDGEFTPEFIYLYPRFQNVAYSNWQYSIDGGVNWVAASGANGLTISTYSSVPNTLRVSRASTLYTDSITSISFRCNSTTSGVYDTVSIAKIYDVVDLEIGGRNLLLNSNSSFSITSNNSALYPVSVVPTTEGKKTFHRIKRTSIQASPTTMSLYNTIPLNSIVEDIRGKTVTLSFAARASEEVNFTIFAYGYSPDTQFTNNPGSVQIGPGWKRYSMTTIVPSGISAGIRYCPLATSDIKDVSTFYLDVCEWKIEFGNKATDWTPAPEDIDASIEEVNTTLSKTIVDVKTTANSAVSRVSSVETAVGTINNNISSIINRVSAAEQKITPTAIISTVRQSTDYTNDLDKKVNSTDVISTINQTAGSVTINANKIGLLGATNIPDLTADKIKGGTLTLGGSNATTQNGQLLVKNASNVDMLKVNKDGIIVKSGHLAVARDFTNQTYDWNTNTWTNSTNTSQLDLGDNFIRMGAYGASGYANSMTLLDDGLYFQGSAHAIGNWDSFVGHDDLGDFVIQETVRSNIYFRGAGDMEMARISGNGLHVSGPISGGIASGNARLFTNVFVKNFNSQPTGYICVKLGSAALAQSSMITIKGHITSYHNSTSFEASCYFYNATGTFFGSVATMTNPDILREVYFAERDGYAYLILGAPNANWSYPTVAIDSLSVGYAGNTASEWTYGWDAVVYSNINSNFAKIAACTRGGINTTLWTGAILSGTTITLSENIYNFKFLTCIMGDATSPWGITMGAFMDSNVSELHFGAIYTDANSIAGANLYGVRFNINSNTSLTMQACGTKSGGGAYMRKIVGWR